MKVKKHTRKRKNGVTVVKQHMRSAGAKKRNTNPFGPKADKRSEVNQIAHKIANTQKMAGRNFAEKRDLITAAHKQLSSPRKAKRKR